MTDWQAWERDVATRALEALEAGSVAVHDALHSLLDCCLQLHPAAARHLYEAAKKDDDMFSPKYGGGQGFGGGTPYGAMPLPGRPTAVPHPATLAGTPAYQQAQVMALREAGHSGPALLAAPPHAMGGQHQPAPFAAQSQGLPFHPYQHPAPLYQPPRHLQHHHHRQAQQQLGPFQQQLQQQHMHQQQQQPQRQEQYPQHWPPQPPPDFLPRVSSAMAEQPPWGPHRGAPPQSGADNNADLQQQQWHQPPQHEAPWQTAAVVTRGIDQSASDAAAPAVRRTLSTPPAAGFGEGGHAAQRGGGLHAREQSWDDFSPAQPPPEASLRAPSAPAAAGTRRRATAGGGGATPLQGRPPLQRAGSPPAGGQPAAGDAAGLEQQHPPPAPVSSPLPGVAVADGWEIRGTEARVTPDQQLVPLPAAVLRHATLPDVAQAQGIVPAVVSVPLDVMAPTTHMQQEVQHQQAAAAVSAPLVVAMPLSQRTIDEVDLQQLAFGRQIGEGGFGRVYAGQWRGLPVAVKVVSQAAPLDGQLVAEFRREIATMAALPPHPHVLPLLAACTAPPHLALVTPFCARGSLYGLLHAPGLQLSWRHIVHLALGAARGMAHLHACHILHRDLKSGNLLVEADWTVRVADFGLSRVMADLHTMTGGLGTYEYMAPEVLAHQRYSEKADVYSFGVVLWEMCARAMPYPGLNGMQAALAVMNRGLRPEIPSATPAPLAGLIREAWAPASAQRPSFDAVVQALDGIHGSIAGSGSHQ